MRILLAMAGLVAALSSPAAAVDAGWSDVTTFGEMQEFYQKNPEIRKIQDKYQQDLQKRKQNQCTAISAEAYARFTKEAQGESDSIPGADTKGNKPDLIAEYNEERLLVVEENIKKVVEEKAAAPVKELYRDYLRAVYWHGGAIDGAGARHLHLIRSLLEKPDGWLTFPTADMGQNPPGAAATYTSGFPGHVRMTTGCFDIVVFSHEMFHWSDDRNGGIDGEGAQDGPPHGSAIENHAYAHMGTDLAGGGPSGSDGGGQSQDSGSGSSVAGGGVGGGTTEGAVAGQSDSGPGSPTETCWLDGPRDEPDINYDRRTQGKKPLKNPAPESSVYSYEHEGEPAEGVVEGEPAPGEDAEAATGQETPAGDAPQRRDETPFW